MTQFLKKTSLAIQICENHIRTHNLEGSEVEFYLTQYLAVVLCGEMHQQILEAIKEKAECANDPAIKIFIPNAGSRLLRSIGKNEISGFLKHFGETVSGKFEGKLNEQQISKYSNTVKDRHSVAHISQGNNVTFRELKESAEIADNILKYIREALEG